MNESCNVAILGASNNPERYSYKALHLLAKKGYHPLPINPNLESIEGHRCFNSLQEVIDSETAVHTLTIYVNPEISGQLEESILSLHPQRVIFNPGTENRELLNALKAQGIDAFEACTLVLLNTKQF